MTLEEQTIFNYIKMYRSVELEELQDQFPRSNVRSLVGSLLFNKDIECVNHNCYKVSNNQKEIIELQFDGLVSVVTPSVSLENDDLVAWDYVIPTLAKIARTCYKSESTGKSSDESLIRRLVMDLKHESVVEHAVALSFRIINSRSITHELVRHRIASFSQESQRYINYTKKCGMQAILQPSIASKAVEHQLFWYKSICNSFNDYKTSIECYSWKPEEARGFLPNDCKTEIVVSFNIRSLRHFFELRLSENAHPDMRALANDMLVIAKEKIPIVFDDF